MSSDLGNFLQTRRAKVGPESLNLAPGGDRRVPGLRREEVALAAGLSVDYYRRMEQGREPHPSGAVLTALSDVLQLGEPERRYLYSLAGVAYRLDDDVTTRPIPEELLRLLDSWSHAGAIVLDPVLDVIALNNVAQELFSGFADTENLLEMVLLDPEGRRFFVDWEASAEATVANLRASADFNRRPARLTELLEKLESRSVVFVELWANHDVKPKTHETKVLRHPRQGLVTIDFHAFNVASAPGYQLLVYQERNSQSPRDSVG